MKCIIHVGPHQTGTSSIQNFFNNQKYQLAKHKILYPQTGLYSKQHSLIPGCFIKNHFHLPKDRIKNIDYYIDKIKEEIKQSNFEICLISSEVFTELLAKDSKKLNLIFEKFDQTFASLEILMTERNAESKALSALKAHIRLSNKRENFRIEIFEAAKLFKKKENSSKNFKKYWCQFNRKLNIINYEETNLIEKYIDFIGTRLSKSNAEIFKKKFVNNPEIIKNYIINKDNLSQYFYLILILIGLEIYKKDKDLEDKLTLEKIIFYCNDLSSKETKVLSKINSLDILNFLILYEENSSKNNISNFISLTELVNIFNFKYEVAFLLNKAKNEIIESLIFS